MFSDGLLDGFVSLVHVGNRKVTPVEDKDIVVVVQAMRFLAILLLSVPEMRCLAVVTANTVMHTGASSEKCSDGSEFSAGLDMTEFFPDTSS